MPASPSAAETGPSCTTPSAEKLGILLVQSDRPPAEVLVLERAAQDAGAADRQAVVAEADRAGVAERPHLGQLLAFHAAGHRRQEPDRNRCRLARCLAQGFDVGRGADRGLGVRHRQDAAVAACRGGATAGLGVLFVLVAGHAQVDVRIEEGRKGVQAFGVDLLDAVELSARSRQLGDPAGAYYDVVNTLDAGDRVEHGGAAQDQIGALAGAHVEHLAQAHAGCPIGVGLGSSSPAAGAGRSPPTASSS